MHFQGFNNQSASGFLVDLAIHNKTMMLPEILPAQGSVDFDLLAAGASASKFRVLQQLGRQAAPAMIRQNEKCSDLEGRTMTKGNNFAVSELCNFHHVAGCECIDTVALWD